MRRLQLNELVATELATLRLVNMPMRYIDWDGYTLTALINGHQVEIAAAEAVDDQQVTVSIDGGVWQPIEQCNIYWEVA